MPAGVVTTGWRDVEKKCRELGIRFRWWQVVVGQLILAKREDGKYATTIGGTGLSIPRQVGKTYLVGAIVFALCLKRPNLTVVWTAHRARTAEETFGKLQVFGRRKSIVPFIAKVVLGSGEESIVFTNGSRILFGARERGFGRGFDEVDVVVFDEAQILTENALDDIIPATNQSRQDSGALLLFMGTPPKPKDPGEVFTRMRTEALAGEDPDTCWIEFGADPGFVPTPLPSPLSSHDWEQIAKANPSYPEDTPREAILRMRKKLGPESFLREGLGIWDPNDQTLSVVPEWPGLVGAPPAAPQGGALAIACDVEETRAVACWASSDEAPFVAVNDARPWTARDAFAQHVAEVQKRLDCPVVVRAKSTLIPAMENAGVRLTLAARDDRIQAASDFALAAQRRDLRHGDYPELNTAIAAAKWRTVDGRRVLVDLVGDLEAATLALWGARQVPESIYEDRGMVTL